MFIIKKTLGGIMTLAGIIFIIFGITRYNSAEAQLIRAFGGSDGTTTTAFVFGIILCIAGVVLLVLSNSKEGIKFNLNSSILETRNKETVKVRCSKCQQLNNEDTKFCTSCGSPMTNEIKEE